MTPRPRANEIADLIGRLDDSRAVRVDAAKARLSVIGARAVEALIEALDDTAKPVRSNAMQLLALIQDPRGREPIKAMLFEDDPDLRAQAARALARFPTIDSAAALERVVRRAEEAEIRIAAIEALIEIWVAGQESALAPVLAVLLDPSECPDLRRAAMSLLPRLSAGDRRTLRRRLERDPVPQVADAAAEAAKPAASTARDAPDHDELLAALGSDEYAVWDDAVQRLAASGTGAVEPIVAAMRARSEDPEYCTRCGMVLKAIGPRRGRAVADLLETVPEPLPLSVLVEVVGSYGVGAMIYRLADVLEAIAGLRSGTSAANGADLLERVRAKAHLELARIGSRVAIQDLRDALDDPGRRVELELLAAVELVGKKDELVHLVRAWTKEDGFMRERIALAIRAVMRRERIRRNSVALRSMGDASLARLHAILDTLPKTSTRRSRRRDAR